MRRRFWLAVVALGAALALLVPSVAPLSGSMDAFASDLANGTFRPFGAPDRKDGGLAGFSSSLGGLTGSSSGNFLPGGTDLPDEWLMDRDGRPGAVTVDHVFSPSLGAMKRLKAYDRVDANGTVLEVADERLRRVDQDRFLQYDTLFTGVFDIRLRAGEPVPIYSPHPKAIVQSARLEERIDGGFQILKDGTDTFYAVSDHDGVVTLNVTYRADSGYYFFDNPGRFRTSDYPAAVRPALSEGLRQDAQVVLARAGVEDAGDVTHVVNALAAYFRAFEEGEIPAPDEVESLYLALGAGGTGCCRHRAFAFMVTAHAVGIPTRVVVNEAHAFVEVMMPTGRWHQLNLGGCGTYRSNNPNEYPALFEQASDPRREANPDEGRPLVELPTVTEITESPARIQKGETYFVNGTVLGLDGRPVPNAQIDVFLNETKEAPGRLTGAGRTAADGSFSVTARVPKDLPARGYQLVARSADGRAGDVRFQESWSDPPVDVFAPTRFVMERAKAAVGVPVQLPGRLVDVDGNAVPGVVLTWRAGGFEGSSRTDDRGRFVVNATFPQTGQASLVLAFAGDDHHGSASATVPVDVDEGAILLPVEPPVLARGEQGFVTGTVALAGADVSARAVVVTLPGAGLAFDGRTDARGAFRVAVEVGREWRVGPQTFEVRVGDLGLEAQGELRVAVRPVVTLDAPETARRDDAWLVEARVLDDSGNGVSEALVELTFDGDASSTRRLLTNRTGFARFDIPEGLLDEGAHTLRASFPGDAEHLAADARLPVNVVGPRQLEVPPWLLASLVGAVLAAGLAVWLFGPGGPGRRAARRALAGGLLPERRVLRLTFPDHPEDVAPVVEPGGAARVRVHAADRDGRPARARVRLALGAARATARAGAPRPGADEATLPVGDARGVLQLEARPRGVARLWTRPVAAPVLVTSYRQAVEQAFVELRREASLDETATAGDLVRRLAPRVAPDERAALEDAARLFDVADYSEAPIDREAYHRFQLARQALRRRVAGEGARDGA